MSENKTRRDPSKRYTSFYYTDWTGQYHRKKKRDSLKSLKPHNIEKTSLPL